MDQKIDLLVSFDTTGSMYPVLAQVRREVEQFVKTMFNDFTDLRLGIIAHGDYCDKDDPYTIRVMDFTRDEKRLCEFVRETKPTYGGDADECYELVLHTAHNDLQWRDDAEHVLLMIGDASPHAPSYYDNKLNLDWKEEADKLRKIGVKVFSVHALAGYRSSSRAFYKTVAETTGGIYLTLDMFNEIVDLIKATCYQQGGEEKLNEFVTIIKDSGKMTRSMENNFKRLRGEEVDDFYETYRRDYSSSRRSSSSRKTSDGPVSIKEMDKLVPVVPGRFQIMTVDENCDIKSFVENNGIKFKKGRGFYELSKAETVQQYKEVIMMDRETGEMFNGSQVREELGLQPQSESGGVKERIHKSAANKFRVFVQSTSVNRKLIAGTTFLYEVDDLEDAGTVIEAATDAEVASVRLEGLRKDITERVKEVTEAKEKEIKSTGDVTKPVEVEEKTTKKSSKKADIKEDASGSKFDTDLEVKLAEKSEEAAKTDSMVIAAEKVKKSGKKSKSLKEAAKEASVGKLEFADIEKAASCFEPVKVDEDAKTIKKTKAEKKVKTPKKKEVTTDRVASQIEKVTDGIGRYNTSHNKKNTTFLKNNLEKLIKEAQALLDNME